MDPGAQGVSPLCAPLKQTCRGFFFGPFGFNFVVIFLVEFCDPASFSLLEAVTSSGKQSCVRPDPSRRHLAVLGGDPALSMCSCIHDKSFKNPGYWCLDTRANNPLEFFSISVLILLCITDKTLGICWAGSSRDPVPSFWQLVLEVRDIPNSHPVP